MSKGKKEKKGENETSNKQKKLKEVKIKAPDPVTPAIESNDKTRFRLNTEYCIGH